MKTRILLTIVFTIVVFSGLSCNSGDEKSKREIISTEHDFAVMADEAGVVEAFYHYAADSAVILRGGKLIKGREAIRDYYLQNLKPGTKLLWAPDYTDVSGSLGYTYGRYTHQVPDSAGNIIESHGHFHTVWKRQADGSWRFVWD